MQGFRKLGYPLGLRTFIIINTCVMFAQYVIDLKETVANPALNAHCVCDVDVRSKRDECCACRRVSIECDLVKWSTTKLKVTQSEFSKFQRTVHPERSYFILSIRSQSTTRNVANQSSHSFTLPQSAHNCY